MFNVYALLLDDAIKPATPPTNDANFRNPPCMFGHFNFNIAQWNAFTVPGHYTHFDDDNGDDDDDKINGEGGKGKLALSPDN